VKLDDAIYFKGKDVALALGYVDTVRAIHLHVDEEDLNKLQDLEYGKGGDNLSPPLRGNDMKTFYINESGLYSLITVQTSLKRNISRDGSLLTCYHR
jgi:prophage antirepressor-like protein